MIDGKEIPYGLFLGEVVNFLIVSLALFLFVVKFLGWVMRTRKEEKAALPPLTKDQELLTEIRDLLKGDGPEYSPSGLGGWPVLPVRSQPLREFLGGLGNEVAVQLRPRAKELDLAALHADQGPGRRVARLPLDAVIRVIAAACLLAPVALERRLGG